MTPEEYKSLLADGAMVGDCGDPQDKLAYICESIFNLCTDDDDASVRFAITGLKICEAITNRTIYDYHQQSESHYHWFLMFINLPFFADTTCFGVSIRASFWSINHQNPYKIQALDLEFSSTDEWEVFIKALLEWAVC